MGVFVGRTRVTLQNLGNIGEFVAAIATIGTLVYLALQIRHNTEGLRVSSYNQLANELGRLLEAVYLNPEFAEIFRRGSTDPSMLSDEERARFTAYLAAFYYSYENLFSLFERGKVEREMWENALENALPLFSRPGIKEFGSRRTGAVSQRFHAHLRDLESAA